MILFTTIKSAFLSQKFYSNGKTLVKTYNLVQAQLLSGVNDLQEIHEVDATKMFFHTCGLSNISYKETAEKFDKKDLVLL